MQRLAVTITLLTVAARPAAAQTSYRVVWWDAASVVAAGGLSRIPAAAGLPPRAPPLASCHPAALPGHDPAAVHTVSGSSGAASGVPFATGDFLPALASFY